MTCESFFTVGPVSRSGPASVLFKSTNGMVESLNFYYGLGVSCGTLTDPATFNSAIYGNAVYPMASSIVDLSDLTFGGHSSGGPFTLTLSMNVDNVAVPGSGDVNYDNSGFVSFVNNFGFSTYDLTGHTFIQFTLSVAAIIVGQSITLSNPFAVSAVDIPAYVGCVLPACNVTPPASPLPTLGGTIKCANFSKIFNPLGIPFRSK